jgi:hypothetical protein
MRYYANKCKPMSMVIDISIYNYNMLHMNNMAHAQRFFLFTIFKI